MGLPEVTAFIEATGFPVAVCIALFWLNRDTTKHYREVMGEFKKALENNTQALNDLSRSNLKR